MSYPLLALAMAVSLAAGVARGFAGFGCSALTVAGLAVFVSPAQVVPAVLAVLAPEVLASISISTMRGAVRSMDSRWMAALLWGNALCIPLGLAALARLPAIELR